MVEAGPKSTGSMKWLGGVRIVAHKVCDGRWVGCSSLYSMKEFGRGSLEFTEERTVLQRKDRINVECERARAKNLDGLLRLGKLVLSMVCEGVTAGEIQGLPCLGV